MSRTALRGQASEQLRQEGACKRAAFSHLAAVALLQRLLLAHATLSASGYAGSW